MGGTLLLSMLCRRRRKRSEHNDIAGVRLQEGEKRSNYCINYLISIHLQDPLACTNHFKNAAKCSILTHLPWQGDECWSKGGKEMRFTGKLKWLMPSDLQKKQLNVDGEKENSRRSLSFWFFFERACVLHLNADSAHYWNADGSKQCDIQKYKNPGWIHRPPSSLSEIRAQVKFSCSASN